MWKPAINHGMDVQYQRCTSGNRCYSLIFQGMKLGVRTYVRADSHARDNQNFWDRWVTKFSKVWGFTRLQRAGVPVLRSVIDWSLIVTVKWSLLTSHYPPGTVRYYFCLEQFTQLIFSHCLRFGSHYCLQFRERKNFAFSCCQLLILSFFCFCYRQTVIFGKHSQTFSSLHS